MALLIGGGRVKRPFPCESPINNCLSWCRLSALLLRDGGYGSCYIIFGREGTIIFQGVITPGISLFSKLRGHPGTDGGFLAYLCYLQHSIIAVVTFSSPLKRFPIPTCLFVPGPLCHMLSFLFSDQMSIGPDHGQIPADFTWESGLGVGMKLTTKELV